MSMLEAALGPHAVFIVGSYVAAIGIIGALAFQVVADNRARKRELAKFDRRREIAGADASRAGAST